MLYHSLVYPHFQYCNLAWGSALKTIIQPLFLLQKRIIRVIFRANFTDHTDPLFSDLAILKLHDIHRLELLKFAHSQLQTPTVIHFDRVSNVHTQNLRNQNLLSLPQPRSESSKRFVHYSGSQAWNELPDEYKAITNSITFKIKLKKYILHFY